MTQRGSDAAAPARDRLGAPPDTAVDPLPAALKGPQMHTDTAATSATAPPAAARGLYAITPDLSDTAALLELTRQALEAGITWLQYRNKQADAALRRTQASALQTLCARFGTALILNDDLDLAQQLGADGVHLGEDDADIASARARLGPGALIGASCYDSLARARTAVTAGASYVAFGAFHSSPSKPAARRANPALLRQAAALGVPRVAIGGITPDNGAPLVAAGADLLAVISGLYAAPDIAAATRAFRQCFQDLP